MKHSRLMQERIRRVQVLFKELGYTLHEGEYLDDTFSTGFESDDGFQAGIFIDRDSKFLELAYTFSFSVAMADFVRSRVEEMLHISYEYGCYVNLQAGDEDIAFSIFSKVYYAGLNYFALKETVRDFREAVEALQEVLDISEEGEGEEESDGDS
ncbi:MAG: hypothetical protein ACOCWS_02975 [Alkalispirochaetaceae bacterium]